MKPFLSAAALLALGLSISPLPLRSAEPVQLSGIYPGLAMYNNEGECGTGAVVPTAGIPDYAATLLAREDVAYLHIRSARNNCYQCRVERA